MIPKLMDTQTGETKEGQDMPEFWWTEGNGACDCNRAQVFGRESNCGLERYVIIGARGDLEGQTLDQIVETQCD